MQRQLRQQVHQTYDEKPLFNADFSVRHLNRNQQQRFSIRGLRLQGERSQPEVLKFAFDGGKPRQVKVQIEPEDDMVTVARKLSRGLSSRGIAPRSINGAIWSFPPQKATGKRWRKASG